MLYLLGIHLALHAADEHYELRRSTSEKPSQLSFERDPISRKRCLVIMRILQQRRMMV